MEYKKYVSDFRQRKNCPTVIHSYFYRKLGVPAGIPV